jgi:plasmid stability protein
MRKEIPNSGKKENKYSTKQSSRLVTLAADFFFRWTLRAEDLTCMLIAFIMHAMEDSMPTLQVRDLPEDVYAQLNYLAEKEHRSLSQETIAVLKEGLVLKIGNKERRKKLLEERNILGIDGKFLPDPVLLIREDRER